MAKKSRRYDKRLSAAKKMPPLCRTQPGMGYETQNDRVLDWVGHQHELTLYLFDLIKRLGYIVYDEETQIWQGVDYEKGDGKPW
jgi:hypothetical protein